MKSAILLGTLADALGGAGQIVEALSAIDDALARAERTEGRLCIAELLRKKGKLPLLRGAPVAAADSEACFRQALAWARDQAALWRGLGSATSVARPYQRRGRTGLAIRVLARVYERLTEGFDAPTVGGAKSLLGDLPTRR